MTNLPICALRGSRAFDSRPFVVGSSFRYSLRDLPDEVPKNLQISF